MRQEGHRAGLKALASKTVGVAKPGVTVTSILACFLVLCDLLLEDNFCVRVVGKPGGAGPQ